MSAKEQVIQAIQRLPDDIDYRAIADEVALFATNRPSSPNHLSQPADPDAYQPRPPGLCAGEFVTPADFDDPLPADVLRDFEGA